MFNSDGVWRDDQAAIRPSRKLGDPALNLGGIVYTQRTQLDLELRCGGLGRTQEFDVSRRFGMQHERDAGNVRCDFIENLHPLSGDCSLKNWKSSQVPAGPRNVCDEPTSNRVADEYEYYRYGVGFLLHNLRNKVGAGYDYVGRHTDQLFGKSPRFVGIGGSRTQLDPDIAAFGPAQFSQPLPKCRNAGLSLRIPLAVPYQQTNPPHALGLLRADGERPC